MKEKTIVICNQKGGVGKTLVAEEIAYHFDRENIPYNLYDLDQQGSMIHKEVRNENAIVNVVDTPGALNEDLQDYLQDADLVIVPTRMSPRDIGPLMNMAKQIYRYAPQASVIYVINFWNRYNAGKDFRRWFDEAYPHAKVAIISQSEIITQAALDEVSVVDYKKDSIPGEQIKELMKLIDEELALEENKK